MAQADRRAAFLETLRGNGGEEAVAVAQRIMAWAEGRDMRETYVPANVQGEGFSPVIRGTSKDTVPFTVTNGYAHVFLGGDALKRQNPFSIEERYQELIDRLYEIPQVVQTPDSIYPHISLVDLADDEVWDRFFGVIGWVVARVRSAATRGLT